MSVTLSGLVEVQARLRKIGPAAATATKAGVTDEAHRVLVLSNALAPQVNAWRSGAAVMRHPGGDLVKSGKVIDASAVGGASGGGSRVAAEVVYTAPYAHAVHENPRTGHTKGTSPGGKPYEYWAEGGQWKFLETALIQVGRETAPRLASRIRNALAALLGRL